MRGRGGQRERTGWVRGRKGWVWSQRLNSTAALVNLPALLQPSHTHAHTATHICTLRSYTPLLPSSNMDDMMWGYCFCVHIIKHWPHIFFLLLPLKSSAISCFQFSRDDLVSVSSACCGAVDPIFRPLSQKQTNFRHFTSIILLSKKKKTVIFCKTHFVNQKCG